jgi:hypothetical protein
MWVSHFPRLSIFLLYSRSYSVQFLFFRFFSFLAIFQVLQCVCLIFIICHFSSHIPGPTVCVSHFPGFLTFLAIFQVLHCVFLILHVLSVSCHISCPTMWVSHFHCFSVFSPYSRSYYVNFSFSFLVSFLTIFQVLQCAFLTFQVFLFLFFFFCHISSPKVCFSYFHDFQFSCHTAVPTVCISHFPCFWMFIAIFQVKQCLCFSVFQYLSFCTFFRVLAIFHVLPCEFLIPWFSDFS